MAKWGEGDPRWIVEERPDAVNVNNWHWTERNATSWSQDRLKELFRSVQIPTDKANLVLNEVDKCDGEASASNRKGKLIFFYEWNLVVNWTGMLNGDSTEYKGKLTIPNLSEENDVSDLDIQITISDSSDEAHLLKTIMLREGKEVVKNLVTAYLSSLQVEFSKGMILPKKDEVKPDSVKTLTSGFNRKVTMEPVVSNGPAVNVGLKIETGVIKIEAKFQCRAEDFYNSLTKIEMVTAFTRGAVKLETFKGGKFELFGGNIHGTFQELVPAKRIVQQWRCKQWPAGHYSTVTIDIIEKEDHTEMKLVQTGVPKPEVEATRENWDRYYWDSLKRTFGFGVFI